MMKKTIIYTRVSTKKQTTDSQMATCKEYAERSGAKDITFIDDIGVSGGTAAEKRKGFADILYLVDRRMVETVIVYSVDRLGRNLLDILQIAQRLEDKGVALVIVKNGIDTGSGQGKMMLSVLGMVAEMERDFIRGRIKDGMAAAKERGVKLGRKKTFLSLAQRKSILNRRAAGVGISRLAKEFKVGVAQIYKVLEAA